MQVQPCASSACRGWLLLPPLGATRVHKASNMQAAEMYFAPALEDLCVRWHVPPRTAAALFVALANGAPDLAASGTMFKSGACLEGVIPSS